MIKRHLSEREQSLLLKHFDFNRHDATCAMVELIFYTGIRTEELMRLTLRSLDVDNCMLHVTEPAKGSEQRSIFVDGTLLRSLIKHSERVHLSHTDTLAKLLGSEAKDLRSVKKMLQRRWQRMRLEVFGFGFGLGLHSLRHSFAARVYEISQQHCRSKDCSWT